MLYEIDVPSFFSLQSYNQTSSFLHIYRKLLRQIPFKFSNVVKTTYEHFRFDSSSISLKWIVCALQFFPPIEDLK